VATKTPPKRDVMLALLQAADSVYVNFDPRRDGVVVPPQLKRQPRVVLQYGMNMAIPIPDLDVGEEGIGATLSFDRMPTWTFVPWSAVFAIVSQDQRGMLWEADVPREVQVEQKKQPAPAPTAVPDKDGKPAKVGSGKSSSTGATKGKRPSLRAVEGGHKKPAEPAPREAPPAAVKSAAPKPSLKVEEARVAPGERPPAPPAEGKQNDEIVEPPRNEKKKRELPPYLRVVK
jgi:stringent starvation protein B